MKLSKPILNETVIEREKKALNSHLESYVRSITAPANNRGYYICPFCGSGTGQKATGAFKINENDPDYLRWTCFSCNSSGDLFDLIGKYEAKPEFMDQFKRAVELYGDPSLISNTATSERADIPPKVKLEQSVKTSQQIDEWAKHIEETDYHRGISVETLKRFKVGYCKEWRHPKAPNSPASERLIIPTGRDSYLARAISPDTPSEYCKQKVGDVQLFNLQALENATKPICVVEGEIDALSIIDCGGEAVGLGGTSQVRLFLDLIKGKKPTQPLVLALDNDEPGERAKAELEKGLNELNIEYMTANLYGLAKDANSALEFDRAGLTELLEKLTTKGRDTYIDLHSNYGYMPQFLQDREDPMNNRIYPTGFEKFDSITLDGGLRKGLIILGAMSSAGKTTFLLQVADNLARRGEDVLYFSLEMSRYELMAKSLSRGTYQIASRKKEGTELCKTVNGLYKPTSNPKEIKLIDESIKDYETFASHLFIFEGQGDISVADISKNVKKHISVTGKRPVVMVDYLQILKPLDIKATDKQNTDRAVVALKQLSRDYKIPVIAISSFNRENYSNSVSMTSFKESGGIEYSSDMLLGLQLAGTGGKNFDYKTEVDKNPREIDLFVLKNRNGKTNKAGAFWYYPKFNCFEERHA